MSSSRGGQNDDAHDDLDDGATSQSSSSLLAHGDHDLPRASHHKRLAMILRYLANMHRSAGQADCFVQTFGSEASARDALSSEFFAPAEGAVSDDGLGGSVVFTLSNFRSMPPAEAGLFASPPFSFYAASGGNAPDGSDRADQNGTSGVSVSWEPTSSAGGSSSSRRGHVQDFNDEGRANLGGGSSGGGRWTVSAWSKASSAKRGSDDGPPASCWLRLTRIKSEDPPAITGPSVRRYLEAWAEKKGVRSVRRLLHDVDSLDHAPALDPSTPERKQHEIKSFLRKYRRHVRRDAVRREMEPLYNSLFELAQRTKSAGASDELVWGFGSARMVLGGNEEGSATTVVNGPLLEVRVEIELAPDGALLVRPCEHTGVELNREVLAALATDDGRNCAAGADVLARFHRAVSEMETKYISPGQPSTYAPTLKRMAVELSSGGRFIPSNKSSSSVKALSDVRGGNNKLLVTDSWCFYHRAKPSSVWARDAQTLAELITKSDSGSVESLPRAALSLTHGPNALASTGMYDSSMAGRVLGSLKSFLTWTNTTSLEKKVERPLFPLPTSNSQDRIHQLLANGAPAVIVEGPPGCGKTHSIANIVCSYLAQGKRVLVTSKGAPALSVLKQRLPECMQELCVDATVSEAAGMQQLQRTVERLADRVSCGVDKSALCESLETAIKHLEKDIAEIDEKLEQYHNRSSSLLQKVEGQELADVSLSVVVEAPWMAATMTEWSANEVESFTAKVTTLANERDVSFDEISGYTSPPSDRLISAVAAKTGATLPSLSGKTVRAVAAVPIIGSVSGARSMCDDVDNELDQILMFGEAPTTKSDWEVILRAMQHDRAHWRLYHDVISTLLSREGWQKDYVFDESKQRLSFNERFVETLKKASRAKQIQHCLVRPSDMEQSQESQKLEVQRSKMVARLQDLDGRLVEAKVITKLNNMFSPEAQSALIKFAQLAGKAKFKSNSQVSRLSQRQQRHRQEYLKAFEKSVRYIPCWILTTNQVSDYLPAEFGLFDVCIIDEASQSDISALPSMLRGKQWLVVGDGKQVSPTESFVSEDQIDSLRVSLPDSPFRSCFLPGHSFFDLCAQAFPVGRVVLREHFRCAPEIIMFSNNQYYQGRLHPLRLPLNNERMNPSLVDIFLRNGRKVGKVNENECNKIVEMIDAMVKGEQGKRTRPKSIGVICLIGDEQSRLIRGRLLDTIGPELYNHHNVLVGEPPSFQGSERDVIFLSMVSSPGSVPTQSQLMHHQRVNVALSRARDRLVLVRSIGRSHIPSSEDVKIPIIDFFAEFGSKDIVESGTLVGRKNNDSEITEDDGPFRERVLGHLSTHLRVSGFSCTDMGVVWTHGLCVETGGNSGARAAIAIEGCGELKEEWSTAISQQRSIERVGWQCLRIDALSWMLNHKKTVVSLEMFLKSAGIEKPAVDLEDFLSVDGSEESIGNSGIAINDENANDEAINEAINEEGQEAAPVIETGDEAPLDLIRARSQRANAVALDDVVVISSNEDEDYIEVSSNASSSDVVKDEDDDGFQPNQYGNVVNLEIGGSAANSRGSRTGHVLNAESSDSESDSPRPRKKSTKRTRSGRTSDEDYHGDESDGGVDDNGGRIGNMKRRRSCKRRKLDSCSRDGRWCPGHAPDDEDDDMDAEDEDWEDLKDVMSDSSIDSGSPSENLRSRSSALDAGPPSAVIRNNGGDATTGSEDFQDAVEEEADGGVGGDSKRETPQEDSLKPETMDEGGLNAPDEKNAVISLL